jgi:hypothetical protein
MAKSKVQWKKGRGKLGYLEPLMGTWKANAESPNGRVQVTRTFTRVLGDKYIQLTALWEFGKGVYQETAFYGVRKDGTVGFWSFSSDGKHSEGRAADVSDIHPEAIGFEAQMPAGLARMAYWPDDEGGFYWVVEAKNRKGWNRFVNHHYLAGLADIGEAKETCK